MTFTGRRHVYRFTTRCGCSRITDPAAYYSSPPRVIMVPLPKIERVAPWPDREAPPSPDPSFEVYRRAFEYIGTVDDANGGVIHEYAEMA